MNTMQTLVDDELLDALYRFYVKYQDDTNICESDHSKFSYISNIDLAELEDICYEIEQLDS